jgi:hypothetical protein
VEAEATIEIEGVEMEDIEDTEGSDTNNLENT